MITNLHDKLQLQRGKTYHYLVNLLSIFDISLIIHEIDVNFHQKLKKGLVYRGSTTPEEIKP